MKKELNKWQIELRFNKDYIRMMFPNLYILTVGVYKFTSFPEEGAMISKSNYKGFRLMFSVLLPITLYK